MQSVLRKADGSRTDRPDAGVYFAMAVRAQHYALLELGDNEFPPPMVDPVAADAESLCLRVDMVEFEQRIGPVALTHETNAAHERYGPRLPVPPHESGIEQLGTVKLGVTQPMTARAEKVAFRDLGKNAFA